MNYDKDIQVRLKVVIICMGFVIVGFALFALYAANRTLPIWVGSLLQNLAGVCLVSGTVSMLTEYFVRRDHLTALMETEARLSRSMVPAAQHKLQEIGLVDCQSNAADNNYRAFIEEARELHVCVNDGRSWIGNNHIALCHLFQKKDSRTFLYVVSPKGPYLAILADKTNTTAEELGRKIRRSCETLIGFYKSNKTPVGDLLIYWHNLPVVHSMYMSDTKALMSPYAVSRPRAEVPLLVFANLGAGSYYRRIREDMLRITEEKDSQCVFEACAGTVKRDEFSSNGCNS